MSARDEILSRLRVSCVESTDAQLKADWELIPRSFRRTGTLSPGERLRLFEDRLRDYGTGVHKASKEELSEAIQQVLQARGKHRMHCPRGINNEWLPSVVDFNEDDQLSYEDLDRSEGVITGCTIAIALTGTIILQSGPEEGRRALSLIPDYHLCVVRAEQVVELVPEAIARLIATSTMPLTLISGPSATADIEMKRVQGVHGPRVLDVIILS